MDRLMSMRVFQRVIDEGGFAAAARALDMSPAVVTRLVADLEEHLGTRLLHRTTRRLSLSDAGEAYLGRVRDILQDIDEAHDVASAHTRELAGILRVLVEPLLSGPLLAPLLASFHQKYPKIVLDIEVASYQEPHIEDYDITLFAAGTDFDGNVIARKIITTEVILVASPAYLRRMGVPKEPQDLSRHHFLRLRRGPIRPRQLRLIDATNAKEFVEVDVETVLWTNQSASLLKAAVDGNGITTGSVDALAQPLVDGDLVQVLPNWIYGHVSIYAALPSRKFLPQRSRVFLEHLTEETRLRVSTAMHAKKTNAPKN